MTNTGHEKARAALARAAAAIDAAGATAYPHRRWEHEHAAVTAALDALRALGLNVPLPDDSGIEAALAFAPYSVRVIVSVRPRG